MSSSKKPTSVQGRLLVSRLSELNESRRRFAAAVSSAQHQGDKISSQTPLDTSSTPPSSSLPPDYTLSAPTAKLLIDYYNLTMTAKEPPTTPLRFAEMIVGIDIASNLWKDEVIGSKLPPGVTVPYWKLDLIQAILELEDAPMESLSPQLQQLKLGFEQIPLDPTKSKGIERRVNEALVEGGEEPFIKLIFSDWRLDRSTIPPTRVLKTDEECMEPLFERERLLEDLRKRKPRLHAVVRSIMAEQATHVGPGSLSPPVPVGRRGMMQRSQAPIRMEELGYRCSQLEGSLRRPATYEGAFVSKLAWVLESVLWFVYLWWELWRCMCGRFRQWLQ